MTTSVELLAEFNAFRATENKPAFADWRKARHMPMLEAYRAAAALAAAEVPAPKAKRETYKQLPHLAKSLIGSPVEFVQNYLDNNPTLTRKTAVMNLVNAGVNYSTARTQYQRWSTKRKQGE